jgi:hypothetical protein
MCANVCLRIPHLIADPQYLLVLRPQSPQSVVLNNVTHYSIAQTPIKPAQR